jgi:hypothetical protein
MSISIKIFKIVEGVKRKKRTGIFFEHIFSKLKNSSLKAI